MTDPFDPFPHLGTIESDLSEYEHASVEGIDDTRDVLAEPEEPHPLPSLFVVTLCLAVILVGRLFQLQIVEGTENRVLAEGNRIRSREIRPPRGEIQDRNGVVLADNVVSYSLEIYPAEFPRDKVVREQTLQILERITQINLTELRTQFASGSLSGLEPVILADQLDHETALLWQIQLAELPGVNVAKLSQRHYTEQPGFGHVLGYVGQVSDNDLTNNPSLSFSASVGKTSLERQYESLLQGVAGEERIEVDARGRVERVLAKKPPIQGDTLRLTLDAYLQERLFQVVREFTESRKQSNAAAVVIDVKTGGILAMTSLPDYDPNIFVREDRKAERSQLLTDEHQPLLNRVIAGTYPSGSTIKPVIATAGLSEGIISDRTILDTSAGVIQIGVWRFPDWKVHGVADVKRALAESNDIFFYALGGGYEHIAGLGVTKMNDWLKRFGFGRPTGIDLPGEAIGLVPDDEWKQAKIKEPWYIGDSYHLAIGQGYFLATPLQLAQATAAVANGGALVTPHLVAGHQSVVTGTSVAMNQSDVTSRVADPAVLAIVREGMRQTVTDGTARTLGELAIPVAGKTGTAQFGLEDQTHSWFVGFAPYEAPEIAIAIVVEAGGESSDAAVPAAKAFLTEWITRTHSPVPSP